MATPVSPRVLLRSTGNTGAADGDHLKRNRSVTLFRWILARTSHRAAHRDHRQRRVVSSSTTARWNIAKARRPGNWLRSRRLIYSLIDLREILLGCNRRYIAHPSALDDFSVVIGALDRLTKQREVDGKTVQGIDFFAQVDKAPLHALQNPKANIPGNRPGDLLADLGILSPTRLSRQPPGC